MIGSKNHGGWRSSSGRPPASWFAPVWWICTFHLREPGQTHKEDIESGSRAAAHAAVFTSVACMANTVPPVDNPALVRFVREQAEKAGLVNVYPIAALTEGLRGEVLTDIAALKRAGAAAISDDGQNLQNADLMRDALILARRHELAVLSHCEDTDLAKITP
jgi:dihydroorotase